MQFIGTILLVVACLFPLIGVILTSTTTVGVTLGALIIFGSWVLAATGGALQAIGLRSTT